MAFVLYQGLSCAAYIVENELSFESKGTHAFSLSGKERDVVVIQYRDSEKYVEARPMIIGTVEIDKRKSEIPSFLLHTKEGIMKMPIHSLMLGGISSLPVTERLLAQGIYANLDISHQAEALRGDTKQYFSALREVLGVKRSFGKYFDISLTATDGFDRNRYKGFLKRSTKFFIQEELALQGKIEGMSPNATIEERLIAAGCSPCEQLISKEPVRTINQMYLGNQFL